jgi:hypothetical protein
LLPRTNAFSTSEQVPAHCGVKSPQTVALQDKRLEKQLHTQAMALSQTDF